MHRLSDDAPEFEARWTDAEQWSAGLRSGEIGDGISLAAIALARAHGLLGPGVVTPTLS